MGGSYPGEEIPPLPDFHSLSISHLLKPPLTSRKPEEEEPVHLIHKGQHPEEHPGLRRLLQETDSVQQRELEGPGLEDNKQCLKLTHQKIAPLPFFFLPSPQGFQDLISRTWDRTHGPCIRHKSSNLWTMRELPLHAPCRRRPTQDPPLLKPRPFHAEPTRPSLPW